MARFFNTAGPCRADDHYMLPPERRVADLRRLIGEKLYFVVHAPRQVGKTTSLRTLAETLTAEGRYAALLTSCEVGQRLTPDLEESMASILANLHRRAENSLPAELRPPPTDPSQPPGSRLADLLGRWAKRCPLPVVVFFDEIDALYDDALVSVLRQLRAGYDDRPGGFPHSLALIGLRDVRDYRILPPRSPRDPEQSLGTASPFNVKSDSLLLRSFTAEEVAELYGQHAEDTGQVVTAEAAARAYELTRGQPWLVNALARQLVQVLVPDRTKAISGRDVDEAAEDIIERRDTHLDSLVDKLREPRVERVISPILEGELPLGDRLNDDLAYVEDLGLVDSREGHLEIANPIYHEVIPRALAGVTQKSIPHRTEWYTTADGRLDMDALLEGFLDFWREHGDAMLRSQPYKEVAFQLVVMSFLQRVTNGGGRIDREYAVGRGRMDLLVHWPYGERQVQREVLELKVWRGKSGDPLPKGLKQLDGYLSSLGADHGALLIFDRRSAAVEISERSEMSVLEHEGRQIRILRL